MNPNERLNGGQWPWHWKQVLIWLIVAGITVSTYALKFPLLIRFLKARLTTEELKPNSDSDMNLNITESNTTTLAEAKVDDLRLTQLVFLCLHLAVYTAMLLPVIYFAYTSTTQNPTDSAVLKQRELKVLGK